MVRVRVKVKGKVTVDTLPAARNPMMPTMARRPLFT